MWYDGLTIGKDRQMGFLECTKCWVWSWIPKGFDERIHFGRCPKCQRPMHLLRTGNPKDAALAEVNRVEAEVW